MNGVNKFGRGTNNNIVLRGPPGIGFRYLDTDGNFDIRGKRLANVSSPVASMDASNKLYVDQLHGNQAHINDGLRTSQTNLKNEVRDKLDEFLKEFNELNQKMDEYKEKHSYLNSQYQNIVSSLAEQYQSVVDNEHKITDIDKTIKDKLASIDADNMIINDKIKSVSDELFKSHHDTWSEISETFITDDTLKRSIEEFHDRISDNFVTDTKLKVIIDEWNRINEQRWTALGIENRNDSSRDVDKKMRNFEENFTTQLQEVRDDVGDMSRDIAMNYNEIEHVKKLLDEKLND